LTAKPLTLCGTCSKQTKLAQIMNRSFFPLTLLACSAALFTVPAFATSPLNCKKAKSPVERTICDSPEFVAMDREIAALYDRGLASLQGAERRRLVDTQVGFIKSRSGCTWASHHSAHPGTAVGECIRDKMETRLRSLRNRVESGR